jgi:integrase
MAIIKDKKRNTWMVKRYQKDVITGELKQVLKRGFKTKKEAQLWESSQIAVSDTTNATFTEIDNLFIDYKNPSKQTTRKQEQTRVQKYLPFAGTPISQISKQTLLEWYVDLIKRDDIGVRTKNSCISLVKSVFKFANEFYNVPNTAVVLKTLKLPKQKEMVVWTTEEFNQFIQHTEGHYRNIFTFMYCTGLRRGEALALCKDDFDLEKGTVRIWHQIRKFSDGFQPLKTESSERTLKLPTNVINAVRPLVMACSDEKPFVFGGDVSIPTATLQKKFADGIKASGVKKIRIHDLRHSFATNAINNGCNIVAVSKYLGHSNIQQTLETYTHLLEKTDDEMIQTMNNVVAVILP